MNSFAELCLLGVAGFAPGAPGTVPAPAIGVPAAVASRVESAVAARWSVEPSRVRLQWGHATEPFADGAIEIAGRGDGGWFVAIGPRPGGGTTAARVRAGVETRVPVAARALRSGETLAASDAAWSTRVCWGPPESEASLEEIEGARVRRPIAAGESLARPAVEPAPLIAAGEEVLLLWDRGPVRVTLAGTALGNAREGDRVRVRLRERSGLVMAIARGRGTAELAPEEAR